MGATLSLAYRGSLDPNHILHGLLSGSSDTGQVRLRSRRPFVPVRGISWTTLRPVPGLLGWAYPEHLGLSSTACGLVLGDSIRPCTNGVSLLHRIASAAPLSKPQTMY